MRPRGSAPSTAAPSSSSRAYAQTRTTATPSSSAAASARGAMATSDALMSAEEAQSYHEPQVRAFADSAADLVSILTVTYLDEAVGLVRAAEEAANSGRRLFHRRNRRPAAGRNRAPRGGRGRRRRDGRFGRLLHDQLRPPGPLRGRLDGGAWLERVRGLRANPLARVTQSSTSPRIWTTAIQPSSRPTTCACARASRASTSWADAAAPTSATSRRFVAVEPPRLAV
jgi:hypothetical protein